MLKTAMYIAILLLPYWLGRYVGRKEADRFQDELLEELPITALKAVRDAALKIVAREKGEV